MARSGLSWRLVTQPAVRFVALGGLLFWLHAALAGAGQAAPTLSDPPREALNEAFALEYGRAPDAREQAALAEQWSQDEALLEHARELRLDETDTVVRRRLIQDVEFLLEAEAAPVEEAAVRARYEADAASFVAPERRSFEHVFVSGVSDASRRRAMQLGEGLGAGAVASPAGEPSGLGARIESTTQKRLAGRLGREAADAAFALAPNVWSQPLASSLGYHLLRAVEVQPAAVRRFEDVRAQIRAQLEEEARSAAVARGRAELRQRYGQGAQ